MTTPLNTPAEVDILRFAVALCTARDDEDEVRDVIEERLAKLNPGLHAAYLKVVLRVVVAQFLAAPARKLNQELGYDFVDMALRYQALVNDGIDDQTEQDDPRRRHLAAVPTPAH
jgi:hypothetical protein